MEIRQVLPSEIESVGRLASEFYAASVHLRVFDMSHFVAFWTTLITAGTGVIFAMFDGPRVAGTIAGMVYAEPYSGEPIAQEFFWFLSKEYRGKALSSIQLYRMFEQWVKDRGCTEIRMGHLSDSMPEKVAAFYGRMGYKKAETLYIKRLAA